MSVMIMVLVILVLLTGGTVALVLGWPHRRRERWHCARCDAACAPACRSSCASCALDFDLIGALQPGPKVENRALRRFGGVLLAVAWCLVAVELCVPPLRPLLPLRVVVAEFELFQTNAAIEEIWYRVQFSDFPIAARAGLLDRGLAALRDGDDTVTEWPRIWGELIGRVDYADPRIVAHVPWMLERQRDLDASWRPMMSEVIEGVQRAGALTPEQWDAYLDAAIMPEIVIPHRLPLRPGSLVPVYVTTNGRLANPSQSVMQSAISVRGLAAHADLGDATIDPFAATPASIVRSEYGGPMNVAVGYCRVPDAPGRTIEIAGTMAVVLDEPLRAIGDLPGFWSGEADLTTIGAPVSARFSQQFPVGEAEPISARDHWERFIAELRRSIVERGPARHADGALSCAVMFTASAVPMHVVADLELRVDGTTYPAGELTLSYERDWRAIHRSRPVRTHLGGDRASLQGLPAFDVTIPWDRATPSSCDVIVRVRTADFPESQTPHREPDETIVIRDVPVR